MKKLLAAAFAVLAVHCTATTSGSLGGADDADSDNSKAANKGTSTTGAGADATGAGAAVSVKKPDPDLLFTFDRTSKTLGAKVKPELAKGTLFVDVFALQHGEDHPIDCDAIKAGGRSVDLSKATTDGKYVAVPVPVSTSDASLMAKRLDGTTRTAIQGCVFDASGKVTLRYATSLMNALDNDDRAASASPRIYHGIEAYTNDCMQELGELPMFAAGDEASCFMEGMHVVPITATDSAGNVTTIDETTTGPLTSAQRAATQRCDHPAWLGYEGDVSGATQCAPFTRIGQYQNSKGTRFIFICRREAVRPLMDPTFENINFIAHNPTSGKTCFFNNHLDGTVTDGTKVPRPDTPVSDRFWMDMGSIVGQRCPACHDSDPWMHSPWVDSAVDRTTGHTIVPKIGEDALYTLATKYSIFGRESFVVDAESENNWKQPQMLAASEAGSCGSCHRIGSNNTLAFWAQRSVGEQYDLGQFTTAAFQTTAKLHWMPADAAAMRNIDACANDPSSCTFEDVPH